MKYRADTPLRLGALIKLEPEFGMSHVLKGYFMMLGFKEALVSVARESEAAAGARGRTFSRSVTGSGAMSNGHCEAGTRRTSRQG